MLLAIDIGNTNIVFGVFRMERDKVSKGAQAVWCMSTIRGATPDEYGTKILDFFHYSFIESAEVKGVVVSSVVPPLDPVFHEVVRKYFKRVPLFVGPGLKTGINVLSDNPAEVGADRIANAVASYAFFGGPTIVVDFGTATTFDCVTKKGEYAGGVIAPGPQVAAESLAEKTAKLPRVDIVKPKRVIGKNTVESLQSGLFYGYIGLVEGILQRLKKEMGGGVKIVATGGMAGMIALSLRSIKKVIPDLTLEGLRIIWEKNQ